MRGKVYPKDSKIILFGITPAYAGKRILRQPATTSGQDHPRLCGEKYLRRDASSMFMGSPPPMRGKEFRAVPPGGWIRITPAYAGKR